MVRLGVPKWEPPAAGESPRDAAARRARNRAARTAWEAAASQECSVCGHAWINVWHNTQPEDQIEGADYYAGMRRGLHEFQP